MDNELKALFGSWVQAAGTVLAAISSIPSLPLEQKIKTDFSLIGNLMQATGNALLADSETEITLNKIGNEIQAFGNSTVIAGILIPFNEETKTNLSKQGNLLQALGSAAALPDLLIKEKSFINMLFIIETFLQSIGNSLQAVSENIEQTETKEAVDFAGSWIQATGAVIQALAQTKIYEQNNQQNANSTIRQRQ